MQDKAGLVWIVGSSKILARVWNRPGSPFVLEQQGGGMEYNINAHRFAALRLSASSLPKREYAILMILLYSSILLASSPIHRIKLPRPDGRRGRSYWNGQGFWIFGHAHLQARPGSRSASFVFASMPDRGQGTLPARQYKSVEDEHTKPDVVVPVVRVVVVPVGHAGVVPIVVPRAAREPCDLCPD